MDSANDRTLATYETHVPEYLAANSAVLGPPLSEWLGQVLEPWRHARVLEVGSGPGTIAEYLIAHGHRVELTDATAAFVRHLNERGHPAMSFNVLTDPVPEGHDVILANAVLLHLTRAQLADALGRMLKALAPGGRLAFTVKRGDGEEWSTAKLDAPRYFCYWQAEPLRALLTAARFAPVQVTEWTAPSGQRWLAVIAEAGRAASAV